MLLQNISDLRRRDVMFSFRGEPSDEKHLLLHSALKVTVLNSKNEHFSCNVTVRSIQINF